MVEPGAERDCPNCGSPADPHQEYCLQCGHRLPPAAGTLRSAALAAGSPGWTILLTAVVALLAAAIVAAVQLTTDESQPVLVATSPQPTAPLPTTETLPETTTTAPETTAPPPTQPPPSDGLTAWPARASGWTIVLASIPEGPGARAVATREARQAIDGGLTQVGVLVSSRYSSLHPGYFVVFSGVYGNVGAAEQGLPRARALGYQAYTRQVVP
ncbi:MAG: zinc ribbon domain-containing protein [Gaiellaceae bacterium]